MTRPYYRPIHHEVEVFQHAFIKIVNSSIVGCVIKSQNAMIFHCRVQTIDLGNLQVVRCRPNFGPMIFSHVGYATRAVVFHEQRAPINVEVSAQLSDGRFQNF